MDFLLRSYLNDTSEATGQNQYFQQTVQHWRLSPPTKLTRAAADPFAQLFLS